MARGKKTGGRDFEKGNPGKAVGTKDKVPRGYIRAIFRQLLEEPDFFESVKRSLRLAAKDPKLAIQLVQEIADRLEGRPKQSVEMLGRPTTFILTEEDRPAP